MSDIWLSVIGCAFLMCAFLIGLLLGVISKKPPNKIGKWLERNGCYSCQEKWKYSLRGQIEDEFEGD